MAGRLRRIGPAFRGICGFCLRPTANRSKILGNTLAAAQRKMSPNSRSSQRMVKNFSTASNAVQETENQKTHTSIQNSLIIPGNSKRETLVTKVKEAILSSLEFKRIFAVVHLGGKQFRITPNDIIMVNKVAAKCGDKIKLQKILMVGGSEFSLIGKPLLSNIHIEATVLEKTKGRNVIVFKKKRRKNYKRWKEHRQDLTVLRINKISFSPDFVDM